MKDRVSIIVPIYNAGTYLKESIDSLLKQTYRNLEIILVDDGSTDNSAEIANSFTNDNVHLIRQPNSGASIARNTGLKHATGEFIQFMDADDYLSVDKIEKQVDALQSFPLKVAVCDYISFEDSEDYLQKKGKDQRSFIYSSDDPIDFLINLLGGNGSSNFVQPNSWLVHQSLIKKSGVWKEYRGPDEDGEFFARVILESDGILHVPGVYNYYRRTPGKDKLSLKADNESLDNIFLTIGLKYQYLKQKSNDPRIEKAIAKQYLDFAVHQYPQNKKHSSIAYEKYLQLNQKATLPLLGGSVIELLKYTFGWRTARIIKHYFRKAVRK